jgi:hypothetical protein
MERYLEHILVKKIKSVVESAGCPRCTMLLLANEITVRAENARGALTAAGSAIEALLRDAGIEGVQVRVQPQTDTIHIGLASANFLDRSLKQAIDRGKL